MPCVKCKDGKWKIGNGKCIYLTKSSCEKALKAYYVQKYAKKK